MAKTTFSELINSDTPVLVDFYADWCGPCKTMSPVIEQIASHYTGKIKVIKIDTDKNPQAAGQYQVRGIPTFILFKKGQPVWRASGAMPKQQLERGIEPFIG